MLSTLARDHLCKNFHCADMRASSAVNEKRNEQFAQIFSKWRGERITAVTKILISSYFFQL